MGMEDTSERTVTGAQSKLEREEKQSVQGYIAIKGTRNGLLLTLEPETPFSELLDALSQRLSEAPAFFRGASLALDTTRRELHMSERTQLEALLAHYQMSVNSLEQTPIAIPGEREVISTSSIGVDPFLATQITNEQVYQPDPRDSADTLFLRRTVRSGQAIHYPSNIVILGDVNPGAEIVAGGDTTCSHVRQKDSRHNHVQNLRQSEADRSLSKRGSVAGHRENKRKNVYTL